MEGQIPQSTSAPAASLEPSALAVFRPGRLGPIELRNRVVK